MLSSHSTTNRQLEMTRQDMEFRITVITFTIVAIFVVCNSFESLLFILHSQGMLDPSIVEDYLRPVCDILMVFNSSINVIIYGAVSSQFRTTFHQTYFCRQKILRRKRSQTNSTNLIPSSAILKRKCTYKSTAC